MYIDGIPFDNNSEAAVHGKVTLTGPVAWSDEQMDGVLGVARPPFVVDTDLRPTRSRLV